AGVVRFARRRDPRHGRQGSVAAGNRRRHRRAPSRRACPLFPRTEPEIRRGRRTVLSGAAYAGPFYVPPTARDWPGPHRPKSGRMSLGWWLNSAWMWKCRREARQFAAATRAVRHTQEAHLQKIILRNQETWFGRKYGFREIRQARD